MNTNIISIKYEDDFCPRTFNVNNLPAMPVVT